MRNVYETIAIMLVSLLSLLIIALIVQYNMIDEGIVETVDFSIVEKVSKKEKTINYLQNLEGYTDVNIEVDPTQEKKTNRIIVQAEDGDNKIEKALEDTYGHNAKDTKQAEVSENVLEPQMPKAEIVDEVGIAIDDALSDL